MLLHLLPTETLSRRVETAEQITEPILPYPRSPNEDGCLPRVRRLRDDRRRDA
ncbi:MAG: hypothetical protein ACLR4Z_01770 [Butyricicoccaceae bacterium]